MSTFLKTSNPHSANPILLAVELGGKGPTSQRTHSLIPQGIEHSCSVIAPPPQLPDCLPTLPLSQNNILKMSLRKETYGGIGALREGFPIHVEGKNKVILFHLNEQ